MSEWPELLLTDVAHVVRGTEPGRAAYTSTQGVRFLRVGDLTGTTNGPTYTSADALTRVEPGDLLLVVDGSPGFVATGHSGAISSGIRRITPKDSETLSVNWLRFCLMSPGVQAVVASHASGTTILHASRAIAHIRIPVPSRQEQDRLVRLLETVETIRRLRAEASSRLERLGSALFDSSFRGPDVGPWTPVEVRGLGQVVTGNTPPRNDPSLYGHEVEWIKTDNIDRTRGIVRPALERLSAAGARRARVVPPGSVLITCIAGSLERIGDAAIVDRQVAINQQINALIPSPEVDSYFALSLVTALRPILQARATGAMTRLVNKSALEAMPCFVPPLSIQRDYARKVQEIRSVQNLQAASRSRLDDLFNAALQRAVRGEL